MDLDIEFERAYRDEFRKWLKKIPGGCGCDICDPDERTWCDEPARPPQRANKRYEVTFEGREHHIIGDGCYFHDDGKVTIFKCAASGEVEAVFNNWDYLFVRSL